MTKFGPCLTAPRLDEKPWGGRRLARFGFDLPPTGRIGEAVVTAPEARIASGPLAGRTLGDVVASDPNGLLGKDGLAATSGLPVFSLLIKIIDAERSLSIQVHPTDALAPAGALGKTEAWHVLDARPGAVIYAGLRDEVCFDELAAAARAGRPLVSLVRAQPAEAGMTMLAPAGTIHALGGGIAIYEIQQPSAITYRLDDWRLPDDPAPPREMHIEQGLAAVNPDYRPDVVPLRKNRQATQRLTECAYFILDRIGLGQGENVVLEGRAGPRALTCLSGAADLIGEHGSVTIAAGQTAVLFAGEGDLSIRATRDVLLLSGSIPAQT